MLKILALSTMLLIGARSAEVLIFDQREMVVNPGEPLNLDCGVRGDWRYCIWESDNGQILQVEDVYNNAGAEGYSKPANTNGNECGIVINSVDIGHHGKWTCKVFVVGRSLVESKNVVVTIKPTTPVLEIENQRDLMVTSEEEKAVVCSVAAARPAVDVRWYLGDKDVTASAETEETPTDTGGIYKSMSTLRRVFQPEDNGKLLMCSVSHKTLLSPDNVTVPITVVFKPVEKPVTTFYQIRPGTDYEVRLNFSANPEPLRKEWRYGDNIQTPEGTLSIPSTVDRYTTDIEDLGNGMYTAKLMITEFTEADAGKEYLLVVENDLGETQYNVKLSMHDAPEDPLSGGAVAGIIIVLLIVVVAVGAAGYARYRQMFCFAPVASTHLEEGKDIREEHDTESARGPGTDQPASIKDRFGQLTQVFKKSKKDQDVKMDDVEKSLTKEEPIKDASNKEQNPEEKETIPLHQ